MFIRVKDKPSGQIPLLRIGWSQKHSWLEVLHSRGRDEGDKCLDFFSQIDVHVSLELSIEFQSDKPESANRIS
jgi:hypothetical protein